jgi:hypothetical protein
MTAAVAAASTPTIRQAARRWRWIGGAAGIVLLLAVGTLLLSGSLASREEFAPDNPGPLGARAIAEVLRQQGVTVTVTRDLDEARRLAPGATLLVDDGGALLDAAQWRALAGVGTRLVVAGPSFTALDTLAPTVSFAGAETGGTAPARCALPLARRAGSMSLADAGSSLRVTSGGDAVACFRDPGGRGQLVRSTDGAVTLLASRAPFENRHVGEQGNAAVALNALGARERLVWLRPDPATAAATARPTLETLTPSWVTPMLALAVLAGVAAAVWRGRRLGPLVVEQLPVVVRSRETVEGRARLYARGGARLRAADALRIGTLGRLAPALGLSSLASVDEIIAATAARTGRDRSALRALLLDSAPPNDAALVALSDELGRLEAAVAVATSLDGSAPRPPTGPSGPRRRPSPSPEPEGAP